MVIFSEEAKAKFWSKVDVKGPDDCWNWKGNTTPKGIGIFDIPHVSSSVAHNFAWMVTRGESPIHPIVRTCGNKLCVNPAHLALKGGK